MIIRKKVSEDDITFKKVIKLYDNVPYQIIEAYKYGDGWVSVQDICLESTIAKLINRGYTNVKLSVIDKNGRKHSPDYNLNELIK